MTSVTGNEANKYNESAHLRQIALTFDDAPTGDGLLLNGLQRTDLLIAGLARRNVIGAMFFVCTGSVDKVRKSWRRLRQYTNAGHTLANHSHTHRWLRDMSVLDYVADIDRASKILDEFDAVAPFFRYPYLDEGGCSEKHALMNQELGKRKLKNGYVTIATYDFYMQKIVDKAIKCKHRFSLDLLIQTYIEVIIGCVEFYDAIARRTLGRSPKHILLLHENDLAALCVSELVAELNNRQWGLIPATEAFNDPIAQCDPDTIFRNQGRVAALAHATGQRARDLVPEFEEEDYLDLLFESRDLVPRSRA